MSQKIPKLLFFGAGNIAQSIIKGLIKAQPGAAERILATAPTTRNLDVVSKLLGCRTVQMRNLSRDKIMEFDPEFILLCVKPQSLLASMERKQDDLLYKLITQVPDHCTILSLIAGLRGQLQGRALDVPTSRIIRVMLNTAAEFCLTSVFYHANRDLDENTQSTLENLFKLIGNPVIKITQESQMDVATGFSGSGIAFFYEMIQAFSDNGVKNGLTRADSTHVAAQLAKAAGHMVLSKNSHPYQLRDDVASPAGTTIFGLTKWHEQSLNQNIGHSIQESIERAKNLSELANNPRKTKGG